MHNFIVTAAKGLDELLKIEIADILSDGNETTKSSVLEGLRVQPGQVTFEANLEDAYKLCLYSRLANRVLLVMAAGKASSAEELYDLAAKVDWPAQFSCNSSFAVQFVGTSHAINNSQFGALKVKDAVVDAFVEDGQARPNVSRQHPDLQIHVRLRRETAFVCLDLSGTSLHQRGYREGTNEAPLKEQLAAAIVYRSGWTQHQTEAFLDPMCGSGTIAIEAAMIAANIAPNLERRFWGFDYWFGHNKTVFAELKEDAKANEVEPRGPIYAFDISTKVLDAAKVNASNARVADFIQFKQCDVLGASVSENTGFIVSNPPYGERLDDYVSLLPLYTQLGQHLKQHFATWHVALLCSNEKLLKALKIRATKRYKFFNGKLDTLLALYELCEGNLEQFAARPSDDEFSNRLTKNIKRTKNWVKSLASNAYRIYDADLPNYNFAIDVYADWVIVQEYAAPKTVPEKVAQDRLAQALLHIPHILNVTKDKVVLKVREKQTGKKQYEKVEASGTRIQVHEHQANFWINPVDYLDVGLFLDHRITRNLFANDCKNQHVLNLFCYTGSVSVHAAKRGAKSITSVDMSNTYLQWAKDNFALNNLKGVFEFVQADCVKWLSEQKQSTQFDRMFIDPPSFSNSKRMASTWDVQRDHVSLLMEAKQRLAPHGKIYFSNNLRSFKLDQLALEALGYKVVNIGPDTIDEDFKRHPKVHHCWILSI